MADDDVDVVGVGQGAPQRARRGRPFRPGNPVDRTLATTAAVGEVNSAEQRVPPQAYVRVSCITGGGEVWGVLFSSFCWYTCDEVKDEIFHLPQ